jgi:integrase
MARRRDGDRVLGPYHERDKWRIVVIDRGGERVSRFFEAEGEARKAKHIAERDLEEIGGMTVLEAIEAYEMHQREDKKDKIRSVRDTVYRLGLLFTDGDTLVSGLTPKRCEALYDDLKHRPTKYDKPFAVDSLKNTVAEAKTFMNWCVSDRGWLRANPLMGIKVEGKRRHRKPQLREDEARKWVTKALELADGGDPGAVAALVALLMAFRASEVVKRVVRDLDDEGHILVVEDAKTPAGNRRMKVPLVLRPLLLSLAAGKQPSERLFGNHWRDWVRKAVVRICRLAGVPTVTAHSMRGLHSTLAMEAGESSHAVAAALGHESPRTTLQSYATVESVAAGRQQRVASLLFRGVSRGPTRRNIVPQSFRRNENAALRRRFP